VTTTTWVTLVMAAVAVVPPWTPPTLFLIVTAIMLAIVGVRAINGIL
jgi:hypothetical protein